MTLGEWIRQAEAELSAAGVDSPRLDAQLLAGSFLGKDRAYILTHPEANVDEAALAPFLARRLKREPLPYILGFREFYGRVFEVTPDVLIPRQETEVLLECVFDYLDEEPLRAVDIGTGSGCIGLTLALEAPQWQVACVDLSPKALETARLNAKKLKAKAAFVLSDLFAEAPGPWDLIISNPPYVAQGEISQPEVRDWEPSLALYAEAEGMEVYERLLLEGKAQTAPGGLMILEVGDGRADSLTKSAKAAGWEILELREDLSGNPRALVLTLPDRPSR